MYHGDGSELGKLSPDRTRNETSLEPFVWMLYSRSKTVVWALNHC